MGQQERPNDANIEDPRLFKGVIDSIPKINTPSGSVSRTRVIDLLLSTKKISILRVTKRGVGRTSFCKNQYSQGLQKGSWTQLTVL